MCSLLRVAPLVALSIACGFPAPPAAALKLAEQEFVCPIGGERFTTKVIASQSQFGMRLDTRPIGAMLSPIPVPVCPGNGFVMFEKEFTPEQIKTLEAIVLTEEYRQARRQHLDYYMIAFIQERLGAGPFELARLYQRASWEAEGSYASDPKRNPEKPALVAQYRNLALQKFDSFLQQDQSHSAIWWSVAAITAELERLLGRFEAAEARIDRMPLETLPPDSQIRKAIAQVREHAKIRNAAPERFVAR